MNLKSLTEIYKVTGNEVRGSHGDVYPFSDTHIGVYLISKQKKKSARKRPDWLVVQNGDYEMTFKAPSTDLAFACRLVGGKKVKRLKK